MYGAASERRKELRREKTEMRDRLPDGADNDEWKRIARRTPQWAGVDADLCGGKIIDNVMHRISG